MSSKLSDDFYGALIIPASLKRFTGENKIEGTVHDNNVTLCLPPAEDMEALSAKFTALNENTTFGGTGGDFTVHIPADTFAKEFGIKFRR